MRSWFIVPLTVSKSLKDKRRVEELHNTLVRIVPADISFLLKTVFVECELEGLFHNVPRK